MSIFAEVTAAGVGSVMTGIGSLAKDLRQAITGELPAEKQAEIEMKLLELENQASLAQTEINKIEAANPSLFVSGWRPGAAWVCVMGLVYTFLFKPLFPWAVQVGAIIVGKVSTIPPLPEVPMGDLMVLLGGMLGLSLSRTIEKVKGVAK
jgi:hypothetical protein